MHCIRCVIFDDSFTDIGLPVGLGVTFGVIAIILVAVIVVTIIIIIKKKKYCVRLMVCEYFDIIVTERLSVVA